MINQKLKTIASFIDNNDVVLDCCCDHAYLAIYLKKEHLCQEVYASDISAQALKSAQNNIKNANLEITTYLSDGFQNIKNAQINTCVIAGVGESTIKSIVNSAPKNVTKFIISSNNLHYEVRLFMNNLGFSLIKEEVIKENNKYYPIMLFCMQEKQILDNLILKYGLSHNQDYYKYLLAKEEKIWEQIPILKVQERREHFQNIQELKKLIGKN